MVAVLRLTHGRYVELGPPEAVSFDEAEVTIRRWQAELSPARTVVLLDQPTVVPNASGQRPVENLVASSVSARYGGVQPANTSKTKMFGLGSPIWEFLDTFDPEQDPFSRGRPTRVLETYPVLALIALGWALPDARPGGRLPKYNPERRATFSLDDWRHVCEHGADAFVARGLPSLGAWIRAAGQEATPRKRSQDAVDACLCLLVATHLAERGGLLVGRAESGYMVVPDDPALRRELEARCAATGRVQAEWVRPFAL